MQESEKKTKMSNQKYSGEVNLDHPVIDEHPDGIVKMDFHDLPPILLKCPCVISPDDHAPPEQDNQ